MTKRLLAIIILSALAFPGCGGGDNAASRDAAVVEAYGDMLKQRKVLDSYEERLALTRGFLEMYPEGEHTAEVVDAVFYYMAEKLDDTAGAVEYAEAVRAKVSDPAIARAVDGELLRIYAEADMPARMKALADRLASEGTLDFDDHWNVIEGAVRAEDWTLVRDYCAKAREMATAGAVRAEQTNSEISEEELADEVYHREGMLLAKDGWAQANQGQVDEALADFARADAQIPRYYFDIPEYDLNVYWARALIMKGEFEAAIERLATDALVMRNEAALAALEEAYVGARGSDDGYEAFARELHSSVARTIDDFEMPVYEGTWHRFSDLQGDVTLLTFWFPT
jgi:tetratricopeptide (TPR) repeat protein